MGNLTYTNNKVSEAISGESQKYQSKITSAGVCDTDTLAAEVAANLKDSAAYTGSVLREFATATGKHLAMGERVTLDGLCRFEITAEGSSPTEDAPWDPEKNRLAVSPIPYAEIRDAIKDLVPENVLKPVQIQLLGAQDATTFAQNEVIKGNTLLCQGKNIKVTAANADEGLYLVKGENAYKLTISASTMGTIDATVPDDVPADVYDRLEVRGRAGNGTNRMLVTASIANFTVKAA